MKDIILVGIQGCGKGTQGNILAEKFGYKIFNTGEAFRNIAKKDTPLAQQINDIISRGDLVPNEITMAVVQDFIENIEVNTPVIFDGIPRSIEQKETLEALLEKNSRKFLVIYLQLSKEVSLARLTKRAEIEKRADDTPEVIQNRWKQFENHTLPMIAQWESEGRLNKVEAEGEIEEVQSAIAARVNH